MKTQKLAILSLFTTLAFAIFLIESFLPPLLPIPGIKLGLSNMITLVVLRNYGGKDAFLVLISRILLSTLFFGQALSLLYSLAGGILCILIMCLSNRFLQGHFLYITSILGALSHNLGQLLIAFLITQVSGVFMYLPFFFFFGIATGLFTGLCSHFTQRYLMTLITVPPSCSKSGDDNLG